MTDAVVLLCNPAAGGGARMDGLTKAFARVFGQDAPVLATAASSDAEGALLARLRALPDATVLCVAGGDGTLHAALQAMAAARGDDGRWLRLALLPSGSANDGARALAELTSRAHSRDFERELVAIARRIEAADPGRPGDLGRVTVTGGARRWFANFAAAGSPADWAALSARPPLATLKRASVGAAYQLCNLAVIARRRLHAIDVGLDAQAPAPRSVFAWFAANARYLGGGLDLGPSVRLDSGRLHVLEIAPAGRLHLVRRLTATKRGRGPTPTQAGSARLVLPAPARLNLDGELWQIADERVAVTVDLVPGRARWL